MTVEIHLAPGARIQRGVELGTLRPFLPGDPRRPWPALVVAKPKGGSGCTTREVAS